MYRKENLVNCSKFVPVSWLGINYVVLSITTILICWGYNLLFVRYKFAPIHPLGTTLVVSCDFWGAATYSIQV